MKYIDKNTKSLIVVKAEHVLSNSKEYNSNPEIRNIIRDIYSNCCAYCECNPEEGAFFQIDHFYPKSKKKYFGIRKDIRNLHYSCPACNTLKGVKNPDIIMSPNYYINSYNIWSMSCRNKIENELYYVGHLLFSSNKLMTINRGEETIKMFNLNNQIYPYNRTYLVESRLRCFSDVYMLLDAIYELLKNYNVKNKKALDILILLLLRYTDASQHFSTMILHNFGSYIIKILQIYWKLR
ncbi:MAG TPA: HNH endonuclease [Ruminiclostridium sp.]